ncbi:MAG: type II secretion system protein GspJ [Rhizobium sp.]|nr:type II secretion system protein GspJ [Rhizobium sp.]
MTRPAHHSRGFTLVELLTALLVLSLLAMMSWRGLGAVLETREQVLDETRRWQAVAVFCTRFERDLAMASPRPVRSGGLEAPAFVARTAEQAGPRLELSRFATREGADSPRRIAYQLNDRRQIELWLWPGLDAAPGDTPARYVVLDDVGLLQLDYLDTSLAWVPTWPATPASAPMPRAVRLTIVLGSGERITRVFAVDA